MKSIYSFKLLSFGCVRALNFKIIGTLLICIVGNNSWANNDTNSEYYKLLMSYRGYVSSEGAYYCSSVENPLAAFERYNAIFDLGCFNENSPNQEINFQMRVKPIDEKKLSVLIVDAAGNSLTKSPFSVSPFYVDPKKKQTQRTGQDPEQEPLSLKSSPLSYLFFKITKPNLEEYDKQSYRGLMTEDGKRIDLRIREAFTDVIDSQKGSDLIVPGCPNCIVAEASSGRGYAHAEVRIGTPTRIYEGTYHSQIVSKKIANYIQLVSSANSPSLPSGKTVCAIKSKQLLGGNLDDLYFRAKCARGFLREENGNLELFTKALPDKFKGKVIWNRNPREELVKYVDNFPLSYPRFIVDEDIAEHVSKTDVSWSVPIGRYRFTYEYDPTLLSMFPRSATKMDSGACKLLSVSRVN